MPVNFIDAVLGNSIQVPCIDGSKAKMNLSAGTQSGTRLRMKGKGMPGLRGGTRGINMYKLMLKRQLASQENKKSYLIK